MRCLLFVMVWLVAFLPRARAEVPAAPADDVAAKEDADPTKLVGKDKEQKEKEQSEAEKESERKAREKLARVVVLKWNGTSTDFRDTTVQRVVKSRIARPDAQFFPEVDLYQEGRKVRDRTVVPAMQPAIVPDQNIKRVRAATDQIAAVPFNQMRPDEWGIKAQQLREMVELIWFVDRAELREPLFLLYSQIGRAAENQNENIPPFFETIGSNTVNYYYYMAAVLAYQDPALLSKLSDQDLYASVGNLVQMMQQGAFPTLKVDFEQEGVEFKTEDYPKVYETMLNGMQVEPDDEGQIDIFLGRTDIYLHRKDSGHGLSERLEVTKLEDKRYFVRDVARKKMGLDLIEQLFLHPNECVPQLDGDILNYLAIYAKLHEKAEIYIAVPKEGNANKTYIWRYDRPTANLVAVKGGDDGFPVRFAIEVAGGILYSGASATYTPPDAEDIATSTAGGGSPVDDVGDVGTDLIPAVIPLTFELRGHYNRLMVGFGAEAWFYAADDSGDATWTENYFIEGETESVVYQGSDRDVDQDVKADGTDQADPDDTPIFNDQWVARNLYTTVGVVMGRDAGVGLGPRLALRIGWTNVPYALQTTGHFGWNFAAPLIKGGERVRPFVDIDARAGVSWPFATSLYHDDNPVTVVPVFGLSAGIGTTF